MLDLVSRVFSSNGFIPHGYCFLWNPGLVWLHVVSDALIVFAYTSVPVTLFYFVRRRADLPFNFIFGCFSVFIIACGATHAMEIWTLWRPSYWASGFLKALTAAASLATAVLLVRLVPRALAIPSPQALAQAHAEMHRLNETLEERIRARTLELTQRNDELAAEISERKRAEEALRRSEALFRTLADSGVMGILTADLKGNIIHANDTFLNMLGYTRDDAAAGRLRWAELTPAEWADADARGVEQLQQTGVVTAWEKEYVRKDGGRVPVLLGAAMLEGTEGECVSFVLDLTERKRAELAVEGLREQHALDVRFRELLDAAPDAMVVADRSGHISLVNAQTERVFGYPRAELVGQHVELLIPERFRKSHGAHMARFFANPSPRSMGGSGFELFARRKDGEEIPIEVSLSPLRSEQGVTVSAAIRDISERMQMEARTRLLADRLASAVESTQDAFALFDGEDRLVLCNTSYRRLLGKRASEPLVGVPYVELLDAWLNEVDLGTDTQRAEFRRARLERRRGVPAATFDVRLRDGRRLRVTDRSTPEGGTVKTIWDLTEDFRLAEELREARAAAESASSAKSEFLSSMSHELRTPLNAILGFAQLLQRDRKQPLSERHRERVDQILKGGEHLLHLIDDILDLSRIESGKIAISVEPISVYEVLEEVTATLESMASQAGIRLAPAILPAELPVVAADRTRFAQILLNFGSNAIKYNRPAGEVVFVVSLPTAYRVRIAVRDTGIGIHAEKQAKLFQAFQRAGQETGPIEGTGIGLFITKRLAELMGGDVGFRSTEGEGSEFWVDLPIHADSPSVILLDPAAVGGRLVANGLARRSILYVEDNPANVEFMRDLIDSLGGFELLTAENAERGIALACEHRPQIILLDINLPGMSGIEAMHVLQGDARTRDIPVIALSAAASPRDKQLGMKAGFRRYLTKPLNVEQFVAALEDLR